MSASSDSSTCREASFPARDNWVVTASNNARLTGEQPGIEQREQELRIAGFEVLEIGQLADLVADRQAQVPQRMQERLDELLFGRPDRAVEHDEQIEVGVEAEHPPAVAAERANGERRRLRGLDAGQRCREPGRRCDRQTAPRPRGPRGRA